MSNRAISGAISKWESVLDEARKTLTNGNRLESASIKHKDNSRDSICSKLIQIVNAGSTLCQVLAETSGQLDNYKSKFNEKSSLLNDLSGSYNGLKNCLEQNFQSHFTKLETIETELEAQSSQIKTMLKTAKSYSDALKEKPQNSRLVDPKNENVVTEQISHAVKSAVKEITEKNLRESRIIIHGHGGEEPDILAPYITEKVLGYGVPIISARLMGTDEADPVCVQLSCPEVVKEILRNSGKLKNDSIYKNTYVSPDRTNEERLKHKKLVIELKAKIHDDPSKWWFIKDGRVVNNGPRRTRDSST